MDPETRRRLIEHMDPHMRGVFEDWDSESQRRLLDWRLYCEQYDAAMEALSEWDGQMSIPSEISLFIEHAVRMLAEREYPIVWVGEEGITVEELLAIQEDNDQLPEWMQVESGETVGVEGHEEALGISIPAAGVHYLDGLTVINEFTDHLSEGGLAELQHEVAHIHAAKQGMVLVTSDTRERYEAGLPPVQERVPINKLTPQEIDESLIEELYFYASDTMGPYVMRDSGRAQRAIETRLHG
jgi:hypothetical protein